MASIEVKRVASELNALAGARFQKMQRTASGYKIKLQSAEIALNPPEAAFITRYPSQGETDGLSAFVKKHFTGKRLTAVTQLGADRVLTLEFDNGWRIVVELFSEGNIIIVDDAGMTRHAVHYQSWADREIKASRKYSYPTARGLDPATMTRTEFEGVFTKDAIRSMAPTVKLGNKYLEEACRIAGVEKDAKPTPKQVESLFNAVKKMAERRAEPGIQGEPTLFPLSEGAGFQPKKTFSEAADDYYSTLTPQKASEGDSKLAHRLKEQQEATVRIIDDAEQARRTGDWVQAHANDVQNIFARVKELRKKGLKDKEINEALAGEARVAGKKLFLPASGETRENKASADAN